ncbi:MULTISPECIES: GNAT family N-acetyltransferase [Pseudomonadati]|uniref:GNAT family N-acetyltransferase n=1 Tax=Shewanella aestuarii TaxID=1028752 RepID=A0ABT0KYK4_9GAMM|nr:GNAT family N-acetyltransferase [Shewanella aestuarii]MCL1116526.1 GNAT family N-acetyltransferase [Shewanella aestuarii]GGN71948.1 N-acetyltransferase [Shewanella aestuarii]
MEIRVDDLLGPEIVMLLNEHLEDMYATSPPESVHALDLSKLRQPEITFWTVWDNGQLAACGGIKQLTTTHAEIKSMRVANAHRRKGVAAKLLQHILDFAQTKGYQKISLETGTMDFFAPARQLYSRFGFQEGDTFADYPIDPNSMFMHKIL